MLKLSLEGLEGGGEERRGESVSPSGGAVRRELVGWLVGWLVGLCPVPMSRTSGGVEWYCGGGGG